MGLLYGFIWIPIAYVVSKSQVSERSKPQVLFALNGLKTYRPSHMVICGEDQLSGQDIGQVGVLELRAGGIVCFRVRFAAVLGGFVVGCNL